MSVIFAGQFILVVVEKQLSCWGKFLRYNVEIRIKSDGNPPIFKTPRLHHLETIFSDGRKQ